jgi:hypothetical protein
MTFCQLDNRLRRAGVRQFRWLHWRLPSTKAIVSVVFSGGPQWPHQWFCHSGEDRYIKPKPGGNATCIVRREVDWHVASDRRQRDELVACQPRCQRYRDSIVNSGVYIEEQGSGHRGGSFSMLSKCPALVSAGFRIR